MEGPLLVLVRHAKSSWKQPLPDLDRPLNKRGRRDAPLMAGRLRAWLNDQGRTEARLVSSPARRALDTAGFCARELQGPAARPEQEPALYHAGGEVLLELIRSQPDAVRTLVLFGHNPGFTDAVNDLAGADLDNLPTCGVACLSPRGSGWQDAGWGGWELRHLDYPKLHSADGGGDEA